MSSTVAAHRGHVLPVSLYFKVFGALVLLTGATIMVSLLGLGAASLLVALTIATIKAGFVVGYFMHLKYDGRFMSLVFFSAVLFLGVFFVLTLADVRSRGQLLEVEGNTVLEQDRAEARAKQVTAPAAGNRGTPIKPTPAAPATHAPK
ncbi:MAG TPA: cytochrome C oxidase subunit IV family protein [Polyangia bacterium]